MGNALGQRDDRCLIAGLLLSMNTATMDGSRALYGISQGRHDDQVSSGVLNSYSVPGTAR